MPSSNRNLDDWINGFMAMTEESEPPVLFRKWTAISTIAAALMRKVKFQLGLSITIYPNLYVVLVGPPSAGKGTAMGFAEDIIKEVPTIKLSAQATSLQALIKRMKENNLTDFNVDGTMSFHSSITIFSAEFTVFLGYHNRELITTLCDWYDCKSKWEYDTIKRDREIIQGVWVNILGGTTPDNIQSSLPPEAIGGGLTSRIIFVNEEKKSKLVILPNVTETQIELQQLLIRDLERIALLSGTFRATESALELYFDWCIEADRTPPFHDKKFDGYNGRRRNHLLSIAMVCSASRCDNLIIDRSDMERAIYLLHEVEVKMGTVFRGIGKSDISSLLSDAITFLESSPIPDVPLYLFYRRFEGDVDKFMMDRVLTTLEQSKYITIIRKPGVDSTIRIIPKEENL